MKEVILLKYGEIVLKGLNRSMFEALLLKDIRYHIKDYGNFNISSVQSTAYVKPLDENCDINGAYEECKKIFGITAISRAVEVQKDINIILNTSIEYLKDALLSAKTFKVVAKRSDKSFPLISPQITAVAGEFILNNFPNLKVDVINPELTVVIEIRDYGAYIHKNAEAGAGGMPVSSNGKAALMISGGIDSPVAGYMIAKRGVTLCAIHFFSYPYTSERAKEKVFTLLRILSGYCGTIRTYVVPFTAVQEEIRQKCNEELFTLIMRRFMMRIAGEIAINEGCGGLITGESIGQVASQTMKAIGVTDIISPVPVFRPVIGMDKEEIVSLARKIGTFETSILPFEDCCTVFTPKHPKTRPNLPEITQEEEKLDVEGLVKDCLDNVSILRIWKGQSL